MDRITLKEQAKDTLLSNLTVPLISVIITLGIPLLIGGCLQYYFLYFLSTEQPLSVNFILTLLLSVIIGFVLITILKVGEAKIFLNLSRQQPLTIKTLFRYFRYTVRYCLISTTKGLLILIGLVLLIIPGIYLMLSYALVDFIIAEDTDIDLVEALKMSRGMVKGHVWELFVLHLSFLPWLILGLLTGVGLVWYLAYYKTTLANFYDRVKNNYIPPEVVLNRRTLY